MSSDAPSSRSAASATSSWHVAVSHSAKRGTAPAQRAAWAVAENVKLGMTTAVPGRDSAWNTSMRPAVHDATATTWGTPSRCGGLGLELADERPVGEHAAVVRRREAGGDPLERRLGGAEEGQAVGERRRATQQGGEVSSRSPGRAVRGRPPASGDGTAAAAGHPGAAAVAGIAMAGTGTGATSGSAGRRPSTRWARPTRAVPPVARGAAGRGSPGAGPRPTARSCRRGRTRSTTGRRRRRGPRTRPACRRDGGVERASSPGASASWATSRRATSAGTGVTACDARARRAAARG